MSDVMTRPDVENVRPDNTLKMRCPKCLKGFHYFETWWEPGIDNPLQGYEPGYVDFGWVRSEGCRCEHGEELEDFVETIASEHMLDFEADAYSHKGYCCETWSGTNPVPHVWNVEWAEYLDEWTASACGYIADGFTTERDALLWVIGVLAGELEGRTP